MRPCSDVERTSPLLPGCASAALGGGAAGALGAGNVERAVATLPSGTWHTILGPSRGSKTA